MRYFLNLRKNDNKGFSLIEVIIVVAIIGILFATLITQVIFGQMSKARDARRKEDLRRLKTAFEEYYNDEGKYPPESVLINRCGKNDLHPYISIIPCDPLDGSDYYYKPADPINMTGGFRIYAKLERKEDPIIKELGCGDINGCVSAPGFNYVVFEGVGPN